MQLADDRGYAMAALLVGMSVMGIMLSIALPVWRTAVQREREAELIFRGEQYAHAIELFSRRTGGFPPSLDVLEKGRFIRKLYKDPMTADGVFQPVYMGQLLPGQASAPGSAGQGRVGGGPAGISLGRGGQTPALAPGGQQISSAAGPAGQPAGAPGQPGAIGAGPIIGVVSKSKAQSLRQYNGRGHYNEWAFVSIAATQQPGVPAGAQTPGPAGRRGRGVGPAGPGLNLPGRGAPPPGRGAPPPGRGVPAPGRGSPFGFPGGFPPSGFPPSSGRGQGGPQ